MNHKESVFSVVVVPVSEVRDGVEMATCEGCEEIVRADLIDETDDMVLLCPECMKLCEEE